jgi:hypothetical protein
MATVCRAPGDRTVTEHTEDTEITEALLAGERAPVPAQDPKTTAVARL